MFGLCRACINECSQDSGECTHNEEERALIGTWVIDEVNKAIEKGYKLLKTYEIWSYEVTQYDKTNNVEGLFTPMMNKFFRLKQQASGWPAKCQTHEEKTAYIGEFLEREGIQLEYDEIVKNEGLRQFSKHLLNGFWGKLAQRENQAKTTIIDQPHVLLEFLANPSLEVEGMQEINETKIVVNWCYKEEAADMLTFTSVPIASYVTAQARLKLYSYLEKLGERVMYYDTDAVIFTSREDTDEWTVPTGSYLGDMVDELEKFGSGSYITEFVSGGPKNYAFKAWSTHKQDFVTVCKVKGICHNYTAAGLVNFDSMKEMVLRTTKKENDEIHVLVKSKQIRRTKYHDVITAEESKIYRTRSEKRKFTADFNSFPYGFKHPKTCAI